MFGLFKKDPFKVAKQKHADLLKEAMAAQRSGNIQEFARLSALAQAAEAEMDVIAGMR